MSLIPLNSVKLIQSSRQFQYFDSVVKASSQNCQQLLNIFELDSSRGKKALQQRYPTQTTQQLYIPLDSYSQQQLQEFLLSSFTQFTQQKLTYLTSNPANSQLILVCDVIQGQILPVAEKPSLPPPQGFDSYAIVPSNFFTENDQQLDKVQYAIYDPTRIVPTYFLITSKKHSNKLSKYCEICQHVFTNKITYHAYFNTNLLINTPPTSPNLASIYCKNDNIRLCSFCDVNLHCSPALKLHSRQPLHNSHQFDLCNTHNLPKIFFNQQENTWGCTSCNPSNSINATPILEQINSNLPPQTSIFNQNLTSQIAEIKRQIQLAEAALIASFKQNLFNLQKVGQYEIQLVLSQLVQVDQISGFNANFAQILENSEISSNEKVEVYFAQQAFIAENKLILDNLEQFGIEFCSALGEKLAEFVQNVQRISDKGNKEISTETDEILKNRLFGVSGISPFQKWEKMTENEAKTIDFADTFEQIYSSKQIFNKSAVQSVKSVDFTLTEAEKSTTGKSFFTVQNLENTKKMQEMPQIKKSSAESYLNSIFEDQSVIAQQSEKVSSFIQQQDTNNASSNIIKRFTVEQMFDQIDHIYKITDRKLQLPFTPFEEFQSDKIMSIYYIICHQMKVNFAFSKLKLLQPIQQTFDVNYIMQQSQKTGVLMIQSESTMLLLSSLKGQNGEFLIDISQDLYTNNIFIEVNGQNIYVSKGVQLEIQIEDKQFVYQDAIQQIIKLQWYDIEF